MCVCVCVLKITENSQELQFLWVMFLKLTILEIKTEILKLQLLLVEMYPDFQDVKMSSLHL